MRNKTQTLSLFLVVFGFILLGFSQFTKEEISEHEKWEEFLKTAEIVGEKQLGNPEKEKTPWKLTVEKEGLNRDAIWRNREGLFDGFEENWKWEIAAYRLDKYLGINMVPPTVERVFMEERGSCQLWVTAEMDLRKKVREGIETPPNKMYSWNKAIYLQRAFDNLIANYDRHQGTILITKDWRMILVDHLRCFSTSDKYTTELIFTEKHKDGPKVMRMLPRVFVENIEQLDFNRIKNIVGEYLTEEEIAAVLKRRDLILREIDRLISMYGEEEVLY